MSPMLQPTRFHLDDAQLAAALTLAGIQPSERSDLPEFSPVSQPSALLQNASVLAEDGQQLTEEAEAALGVVADPALLLSVVANVAGQPVWTEAVFLRGDSESPFVSQAVEDGMFDFAVLPTVTQAAILVDEMLGLTALPSQVGTEPVPLDLMGYAAVLAAADGLQSGRLEARLSRERLPELVLTPDLLELQLVEGLANTDTRWAITAGRMVCPTDLGYALGRMEEGIAALEAAALVEPRQGGHTLTLAGYALAAALGDLVYVGSLSLALASSGDRYPLAHVSVLRTAFAIWLATWTAAEGSQAALRLYQVDASAALGLLHGLLEPDELPQMPQPPSRPPRPTKATPRRRPPKRLAAEPAAPSPTEPVPTALPELACAQCGAALEPGQRFCEECGAAVEEPRAEAPKEQFCTNCGQPVDIDSGFCAECGTEVG